MRRVIWAVLAAVLVLPTVACAEGPVILTTGAYAPYITDDGGVLGGVCTEIGFRTRFFCTRSAFPDGFEWDTLQDFRQYKVGGVRGYWYEEAFEAAELDVHWVSTDQQIIQILMKGRIDFALFDELAGWALIDDVYPDRRSAFAVAGKLETSAPLRLMVSRTYPGAADLTRAFNEGLKDLISSGTYHEILRRNSIPLDFAVAAEPAAEQ